MNVSQINLKNPPKQICCQAVLHPTTTGLNYFILYTVIKSILILRSEEKKTKGKDTISVVYN